MVLTLASGGLAPWGQAAAIILGIYIFVSIILGLVVATALMFALSWLRNKVELVNKLRPFLNELNSGLHAGQKGDPLPQDVADKKIIQVMSQVPRVAAGLPARANAIEQKVENGSDRVAKTVIEVRARTEMVKGMARALFLPGLKPSRSIRRSPVQTQKVAHLEPVEAEVRMQETNEEPPRYEEEMTIVQSSR
jgi:hypothetical protein